MVAPIPPVLKYSNVYNLLNFPLILIKFVSKFIAHKVLYFKAQHLLRLRSPLMTVQSYLSVAIWVISIYSIWLGLSTPILRVIMITCQPQWLSWMRCPSGDQEIMGLTPAEVGNILSWRLITKYFLWSFSPFRWFKKGSCQFLAKEYAQYWLTI